MRTSSGLLTSPLLAPAALARRIRFALVVGLVASFLVTPTSAAQTVMADAPENVQASQTSASPDCTGDDNQGGADTDERCLPKSDTTSVNAVVLGSFGGAGTITIRTSFLYPACDEYQETQNCYFSVDKPEISGCTYLEGGDPRQPADCGSYLDLYAETPEGDESDHFTYESGTATSFGGVVSVLRCSGAFNTVYIWGGDARTDYVWRTRGPRTANCDIEVNLPTPDALPGPTFLQVRVGGRVCAADSAANCGSSRHVNAYAWLPVFGAEAPEPPVDPVVPARIFDTRPDEDTVDGDGEGGGQLEAGSTTCVKVAGRAGVPANAAAVVVNATAIQVSQLGFVTLFAKGTQRPSTSSLNYAPGQSAGNTAIVEVGAGGEICAYTSAKIGLVMDITSYVSANSGVKPLEPARFMDTRADGETADGENQGDGRLEAREIVDVPFVGRGEVPDDTIAVAVNITAVGPDANGFVTLYPCDGDQPTTSSLNYKEGETAGNSAVVKLSDDGRLCAYTQSSTHLVLDVTTAFSANEDFDAFNPLRLLETRSSESTVDGQSQGEGSFEAGDIRRVDVAGRAGISDDAAAVAVNLTAVNPEGTGYVTLYPCDEPRPVASSLNFGARDFAIGNSAIVKLSDEGELCVYAHEATHLVMDANASWKP